jgi:hypothetical protein
MKIYDDAVSYIKKTPERFFRTGSSNPIELATHVLGDALIAGATATSIFRVDGWWVIGSDVDWLINQGRYTIKDLFSRIVSLPLAGPNSMRAEILLTAFTGAVITVGNSDCLTLKGGQINT